MVRRIGENRLHLRDRQPEIGRDVGLIDAGLPVLNDVIGGHPRALQHGPATLYAGLHSDEGAIRPIHNLFRFLFQF